MIFVKHLLDAVEENDGRRIWVEPIGLTRDLAEWQQVGHLLTQVAPPGELCHWFEKNHEDYLGFRSRYFDWLGSGPYLPALHQLARAAREENLTLLHHGDDPAHNSATALFEFLSELEAHISEGE